MRKFAILLLTLILSPLIAGVFGIIHDQLTYSISEEYYTKFKFYQFALVGDNGRLYIGNARIAAIYVGFMATWWVGIIIGLGHGLTGLIQRDHTVMKKVISKAILITLVTTLVVGLIGLAYGKLYLAHTGVSWPIPENVIDKSNYIAVGSMHNFSYLGGLIGLIAGMTYQIRVARLNRKSANIKSAALVRVPTKQQI
ncbi:MAG: hypothetical protein H7Y13_16850 [Sphingobacteriaceae bacterium]|nr:hypothetical protein [Sphingobacteriaceae bacterium]